MEDGYEQRFATSDLEHETIKKYEPKYLGLGGQHVVYEAQGHPNVVIKVQGSTLLESVKHNQGEGENRRPEDFNEQLEGEKKRLKNMRDFFGREHTLSQRFYGMNVPVNGRLLNELNERYSKFHFGEDELSGVEQGEVATIVSIQEKSAELSDSDRISVTSGYSEESKRMQNPEFVAAYDRVTTDAVIDLTSNKSISIEDFSRVHPPLGKLLAKVEEDPMLHAELRDFVKKSVGYSRMHGETLDLAGGDNVIFFQGSQDEWDYKLVDALYPSAPPAEGKIEQAKKIVRKVAEQGADSLDGGERNVLMNTMNYVRTINGLANYLGEEERISIVPDNVDVSAQELMKAAKKETREEGAVRFVDNLFPDVSTDAKINPQEIADKMSALDEYDPDNVEHQELLEKVRNGSDLTKQEFASLLLSS